MKLVYLGVRKWRKSSAHYFWYLTALIFADSPKCSSSRRGALRRARPQQLLALHQRQRQRVHDDVQ